MLIVIKAWGASAGVRRGVLLLVLLGLLAVPLLTGCSSGRHWDEERRSGDRHHRESRHTDRDHGRSHEDCGRGVRDDCED